ncbi:Os01g0513850, partial [Oryza sativa Japonica Group]
MIQLICSFQLLLQQDHICGDHKSSPKQDCWASSLMSFTTIRLQSVLREKNSREVSPPLSNGLMLSFFLEYLTALSRFRWNKSASTEFRTALVLVPWRISVFLPVSTW